MKINLLILFFLSVYVSMAQERADIGVIFNSHQLNKVSIDFRKPLENESYKLIVGASIGSKYGSLYGYNSRIIFGNDSLIMYRNSPYKQFQGSLKFGMDKRLADSFFSIGANFIFSYRDEKIWFYNEKYFYIDSTNLWVPEYQAYPHSYESPSFESSLVSKLRRGYFVPQLQFNFSANIPLNDQLLLHFFVGQLIASPIQVSETQKVDPLNEFSTAKVQIFEMSTQAGLGVRFLLK